VDTRHGGALFLFQSFPRHRGDMPRVLIVFADLVGGGKRTNVPAFRPILNPPTEIFLEVKSSLPSKIPLASTNAVV